MDGGAACTQQRPEAACPVRDAMYRWSPRAVHSDMNTHAHPSTAFSACGDCAIEGEGLVMRSQQVQRYMNA